MNIRKATLLPALLFIISAVSCTRDKSEFNNPVVNTRSESDITLALRLPATYSSQEATTDENLVKSLYILAFRDDEGTTDGDQLYDYSALAYSITDGSQTRYKNVKATLLKKDYPQKLVLIANAKTAVESLNLQEGVLTKKQVLEKLEFARAEAWHSETGGFVPIPMWGEYGRLTVEDNMPVIGTVVLTRMVSRIDVVKDDIIEDDLFTLESVHLYNHHTKGCVAPSRAATHWNESDWKAIFPTCPSAQKTTGPISVKAVDKGTSKVLPTMYAFESEASSGASDEATCVIIGGIFDKSGKESFYRVDFVDKDPGGKVTGYKHLLRNHIYRINIKEVYGEGRPTPDEAFESEAVNIIADVKEWEEGSITDVVFDKDYMLGVSQTEYYLPKNLTTDNLLIVTTDVPGGGKLECDADWLTLHKTQFPADTKEEVYFTAEENTTISERTAKIKVSAGRLSIIVTVKQGLHEKYSLHVEDEGQNPIRSLLFTSYGDQLTFSSRTVKAIWSPAAEECMVSHLDTSNPSISYATHPFTEPVIHGGQRSYTVMPTQIALGQFMEKSSRVNFVVGDGSETMVWPLSIKQVHYELFASPEDSYPLDGSKQEFTLSTNADWSVEVTSGNSSLATLSKRSGTAVPAGEPFTFTMANDPEGKITDRSMTLTFTYTGEDGRAATKTVVINAAPARGLKDVDAANCYILSPDGEGVLIPLSWANTSDSGEMIAAGDNVKIKVIWLDTDKGIGDNSVISSYKLKGNGSSGEIEVYPGSREGNALIGAYVGTEIRWSWHIWVTNYDVEGTAFSTSSKKQRWMNVNIGSVTDTKGSTGSYGLFYQWGRKDPFPNSAMPLWDEEGNPVSISKTSNTRTNNVRNSISVPTTFFTGNDWITTATSGGNQYRYLWTSSSNKKTAYDPCPAGWMMPYYDTGSTGPFTDLGWGRNSDPSGQGFNFTIDNKVYFFQAAGRFNTAGNYENVGNYGYYWTGLPNINAVYESIHMNFYGNNCTYYQTVSRANGMNVRCVKE